MLVELARERRASSGRSSRSDSRVLVVRRRSLAVALVTAQALLLVGFALQEAESSGDVLAAGALALRAIVLAGLFLLLVCAHALGAARAGTRARRSHAPESPSRWRSP